MMLLCPLCRGVNFSSEEKLLYNLISSVSQRIACPLCTEILRGFEKFTIHLCSHILKCDSDTINLNFDPNISKINESFENIHLNKLIKLNSSSMTSSNMKEKNASHLILSLPTDTVQSSEKYNVTCHKFQQTVNNDSLIQIGNDTHELYNLTPVVKEMDVEIDNYLASVSSSINKLSCQNYLNQANGTNKNTKTDSTSSVCSHITIKEGQNNFTNETLNVHSKNVLPSVTNIVERNSNSLVKKFEATTKFNNNNKSIFSSQPLLCEDLIMPEMDIKKLIIPTPASNDFFTNTEKGDSQMIDNFISEFNLKMDSKQNSALHCVSEAPTMQNDFSFKRLDDTPMSEIYNFKSLNDNSKKSNSENNLPNTLKYKSSIQNKFILQDPNATLTQTHCNISYVRGIDITEPIIVSDEQSNTKKTLNTDTDIVPANDEQTASFIILKKTSPSTTNEFQQNVSSLENNFALNLLQENVKCNVCAISLPDTKILALHNELVHDKNTIKRKFEIRNASTIHQQNIFAVGKSFSISANEQNEDNIQYLCNVCNKIFKKEYCLTQHLRIHDEKQWICDECGKVFTTKYSLQQHKRLHTGEMPYVCITCNKQYTFQQSYQKHLSYHNNEKPYACKDCNRSFKELSTLYNHQRRHTGEKPYMCDICGKKFRQRVSCLIHSRIHTGIKPYDCPKCHIKFRYKVSLKSHMCISGGG